MGFIVLREVFGRLGKENGNFCGLIWEGRGDPRAPRATKPPETRWAIAERIHVVDSPGAGHGSKQR